MSAPRRTLIALIATTLCALPALAQPVGPAPAPAHPTGGVATPKRPVGGRVDTLAAIEASLRSGPHAVLLLGREAFDAKICRVFVDNYSDSFVLENEHVIYFTRRTTYPNQPIKCEQLNAAYDAGIWADLNQDLSLDALPESRVLLIVCTDARGRFVNKGYVMFDDRDNDNTIQRRFTAFDSYLRRGAAAWGDEKLIDGSFDLLDSIKNVVLFRSPKNTPCR